jgi:hypothetical protein
LKFGILITSAGGAGVQNQPARCTALASGCADFVDTQEVSGMSPFGPQHATTSARYALLPQETEPERQIVKQILSYFIRNPKAADSLEGVAHWRLLEEQVHRSVQQTEIALEWLVAEGFLQEVQTSGSTRIFKLNPERGEDAVRFIAEKKNSGKKS